MMKPLFVSFALILTVGGCNTPQSSEEVKQDGKNLGGALLKPRKAPVPSAPIEAATPDTRDLEAPETKVQIPEPKDSVDADPVIPIVQQMGKNDSSKVSHSLGSPDAIKSQQRCEQLGGCPDLVQVEDEDFGRTCNSYCTCTGEGGTDCGHKPADCTCGAESVKAP